MLAVVTVLFFLENTMCLFDYTARLDISDFALAATDFPTALMV